MFFLFLYPIRLPISTISQLTNQIFHHQKLGKIYFMSYFTTQLTELKKVSISLQLTALLHFAIKNYRDEIDQSKFWAFNFFVSKKAALIFFCFLTIPFLKRHNSITKNTTILQQCKAIRILTSLYQNAFLFCTIVLMFSLDSVSDLKIFIKMIGQRSKKKD